MAIDPNKMAAFAEQGPKPGSNGNKPGGPPGGAPPKEEPSEDMKEGGEGRFGKLIPLLEANAEELEACCDEIDSGALMAVTEELPDSDHEILLESFSALPDDLQDEMIAVLGGITSEEADELAAHLEGEDMIEDAARTAAYFQHLGKLIDAGDISTDDEEGDEDGGDDEGAGDDDLEDEEELPEGE